MTTHPPARAFFPDIPRSATGALAPIQREFDRLFERLGDGWASFADVHAPRMDLRSTAEGMEVTVELPGIAREDVKVAVEDDVLTISGEKKTSEETKPHDYRLSERAYGAFSRSIVLPSNIATNKIEATLRDGVLTVNAPRDGEVQPKTITIKSAS